MDFNIGNLVSGALGAVAKVGAAVSNVQSKITNGFLEGIEGGFTGVAEAVLGAITQFANVLEAGMLNYKLLFTNMFKVLVGAQVSAFGLESNLEELLRNIAFLNPEVINNLIYHLGISDIQNGTTCEAGDPVNVANGNFILQKGDIFIKGTRPLKFIRSYNSRDSYQGELGSNWHNNFEIKLKNYNEKIEITYDDGHVEDFILNNNGTYSSMVGKYDKLIKNGDGTLDRKSVV